MLIGALLALMWSILAALGAVCAVVFIFSMGR